MFAVLDALEVRLHLRHLRWKVSWHIQWLLRAPLVWSLFPLYGTALWLLRAATRSRYSSCPLWVIAVHVYVADWCLIRRPPTGSNTYGWAVLDALARFLAEHFLEAYDNKYEVEMQLGYVRKEVSRHLRGQDSPQEITETLHAIALFGVCETAAAQWRC